MPFLVVALRGHDGRTDNDRLIALARGIRWGDADLSFVSHVYPVVPVGIAALVPSATALGIVGALCGGAVLESLAYRLAGLGLRVPVALVLVLTLGLTPSFAILATSDLSAFLALTLLALAIEGYLRFTIMRQTHGGFRAGLFIGLAGLCTPAAVVMALGFALSVSLVARERFRHERAAIRACASVLLFPTVAGILGWVFLNWRMAGSALGWLHGAAPGLGHPIGPMALRGLEDTGHALLLRPMIVLAFVLLLASRRPAIALLLLVPPLCIVLALSLGLPFSAYSNASLLGILALAALPRRPSPPLVAAMVVVAVCGLGLSWLVPLPGVSEWVHGFALG